MRQRKLGLLVCLVAIAITLYRGADTSGQPVKTSGEWRHWGGDGGNTHYAPLDQIDASNFSKLEVAWRFKTEGLGPRPDYMLESTPLMVNGVIYTSAGATRDAVALDAKTGEVLWLYRPDEGRRAEASLRRLSGRGVSYWTDGRGDERIFLVTIGYQLVALNAKNGHPITSFGKDGIVDLKQDDDQILDPITGGVAWNGSPAIARNVVIVGAAHGGGRSKAAAKGYIRGYDARTGKRLWIFHTIPQPGEFGNETWENDSWSYSGNAGVWTQISVDEELGIAYLPVEDSTNDYYGGDRRGDNLFADSLVAVDLETGKRLWHFQFVHHPIWDYDIPTPPILADITVDGKKIKAALQLLKQGFLFAFDRQTGQPVWPIEERPVPQSTVPGERTSATQPFPTKPPPFNPHGFSEDMLNDLTPEIKAAALRVVSSYTLGPLYTPGIVPNQNGKGLLFVPNGANWPGGSYDPDTGILYVFSQTLTRQIKLSPPPGPARPMDAQYVNGGRSGDKADGADDEGDQAVAVMGLPITRPPWARITAIDTSRGSILWQVAHGDTPSYVTNHPALKGVEIPRTGRMGTPIGTLATKTLLIAGETGFFSGPGRPRGALLRAYDKATGRDAGQVYMPAPQTGVPMTYMLNGKQYIVLAIGSGNFPAELIAFALPGGPSRP